MTEWWRLPDGVVAVILVNLVTRKLTNGHPDFIQIASKTDGKDYPQYQSAVLANVQIDGTKTPATYSETVIDDHAVNVIAKLNCRINTRGVRRIDADGKTMTIDVVSIDQRGKETPIKLVFNRRSNGCTPGAARCNALESPAMSAAPSRQFNPTPETRVRSASSFRTLR
jgi:hypothetical protein